MGRLGNGRICPCDMLAATKGVSGGGGEGRGGAKDGDVEIKLRVISSVIPEGGSGDRDSDGGGDGSGLLGSS